uniref:FLYWCH family member 2 n=1 Tax=Propithecus coquereli TaxID=379532 RepID=A0A2K6FDT3_PROCO
MPLPEASEQEGESVKAGQEPSVKPGTDVIPAAPRKPKKFSKLVLLTASKDSAKVAGAKRKGVHCIMSLGVPGPATLAKALLKTHPEAQRAIEAAPQEPEPKRSKLDAGEALAQGAPPQCRRPSAAPHGGLLQSHFCLSLVLVPLLPLTTCGKRGHRGCRHKPGHPSLWPPVPRL